MKSLLVVIMTFALVLCFGKPGFAQHGRGGGGGFGGSAGKGFGGMPGSPGGEGKGHFGGDFGSSGGDVPKGSATKGNSAVTAHKTTGDLLTQNTKLSSNLQGLLPSGTNIQDAAQGFDHLGQFVAAVHVSHNLGIPFDQLKTEMTHGNSLGEAIHKLKPNADARQEAIKANQQAIDDMEKSMGSKKDATAGGR